MNLDDFIADAKRLKAKPKARRDKQAKTSESDFKRTQAELRQLKLDHCVPTSIHLRVTHQTCTFCSSEYHSVNTVPLLKRVGKNLTYFQPIQKREAMEQYAKLPHYHEHIDVPLHTCPLCILGVMEQEPEHSTIPYTEVDNSCEG